MATVNYTLRLDESDKLSAEQIFSQLGLTLAAGLNIYVKAVVHQQKIPFELSLARNNTSHQQWYSEVVKTLDAAKKDDPNLTDSDWEAMANLRATSSD